MAERTIAIDIERLLAPISQAAPAGAPLRYEGTYDRVREARREDDPTLPQGVWATRLKTADWKLVAELCAEALARRSKDLQIAAWLTDAWAQIGGIGAAAPGLRLIAGLCDRYWDAMFPALDDDGLEARGDLVGWLDEALARRLRMVPLLEGSDDRPPCTLADWESGRMDGGSPAEGARSAEPLAARLSLVDRSRWTALQRDARAALSAAEALERSLAARMDRPPVLHRTRGALRLLGAATASALGEPADDAPAPAAGEPPAQSAEDPAPARGPGLAIQSRVEAYRRLNEAADYLLRTEPHSPVPYLVKRAISWGNMSLAELLGEFVSSADDLVAIYRLLGMRGREEGDAG
ncbi:type VI secretion system protein TssA [Sorangium sp. So ce327]|jgi:type VI secretion system protein ImpA|uniref:type VI secretion system protein TssA n=1 Tax=Sorangium sp. So ce327 TaxID=3133301 RepID=UPI003F600D31